MFRQSVIVQNQLIASDGLAQFDLGVLPMSVLLLNLRPLNETSTAANYIPYVDIVDALSDVRVVHNGVTIVAATGKDLAALNYFRRGVVPGQANPSSTDNARRSVLLPLYFGRMPFDPRSCFPAARRGELVLECDFDIASTGYDGLRFSAEVIELPGARPTEFERVTTQSQTFASTGPQDVDLPLGHLHRGYLLFGTTGFIGASPAPSWGRIELLLDNQQHQIAGVDFETLVGQAQILGGQPYTLDSLQVASGHQHNFGGEFSNHAFINLDPLHDDAHSVDTSSVSRASLRADAETADAVRVLTVERMRVSDLAN